MDQPDIDQLRAQHPHGLNPLPTPAEEQPATDNPTCQHGCPTTPCRHTITSTDPFLGRNRELRGIPLIGAAAGAIKGTRPGDPAKDIDRDAQRMNDQARQIVKQHMREARRQLGRPDAP